MTCIQTNTVTVIMSLLQLLLMCKVSVITRGCTDEGLPLRITVQPTEPELENFILQGLYFVVKASNLASPCGKN